VAKIDPKTLREAQLIMLDSLIEFDRICKKYNFDYWLDSGTLLGAVRHKGFIPWDDDIDISMPVEDYRAFAKMVNESEYTEAATEDIYEAVENDCQDSEKLPEYLLDGDVGAFMADWNFYSPADLENDYGYLLTEFTLDEEIDPDETKEERYNRLFECLQNKTTAIRCSSGNVAFISW